MPSSHSIDVSKGVILVTSTGHISDSDWINCLTSLARDQDFHADLRGFVDYTGVTASSISAQMVAYLAENPAASPQSRWAFLVKPGLASAMIEFYKSNLRHGQLEIFHDRAKALAWLNEGVSPEKVIT